MSFPVFLFTNIIFHVSTRLIKQLSLKYAKIYTKRVDFRKYNIVMCSLKRTENITDDVQMILKTRTNINRSISAMK